MDKFQYDREMTRFHHVIITRLRNSSRVWWFSASLVNLVTRLRPSKQSLVIFCQSGESDDQLRLASRVWSFSVSLVNLMIKLRPSKQSLVVFC